MKGSDILTRARTALNDADAVRWTDAELIQWINDGCKFIVGLRPDAGSLTAVLTLAAGTRQSVAGMAPPGLRLLDVIREEATGSGVRLVDREVLDAEVPGWHKATPGPVDCYVHDNREPATFYVFPPAVAGAQLQVMYVRAPVEITAADVATTDLTPPDVFLDPLLNYVLHRAKMKEGEGIDVQVSAGLRSLAEQLLTGKASSDRAFSPDFNSPGARPAPGAMSGGV